jgi:hypothetical protein
MPVVHEPSLQLLQFATHLPADLAPTLSFCALLFGELAMLGSSLCESRKAVLGPRASGSPSMELTAPHREPSRSLAQGPPTGPSLAPNTLPVWAVEPWLGIGFHCAQLSSIHGVLVYPTLEGVTRHAWLGPRTAVRTKPSNANWAQATLKADVDARSIVRGPRCLVLGSRSMGLHKMVQKPRARFDVAR